MKLPLYTLRRFSNCKNEVFIISYRTMTHNVFVYGTLKRNEPNYHWLTDAKNGKGIFINEGTTKTKYPLIIATKYNIPFLLYSPGKGHHVKGEIYEVDDLMMSKLDILEGHPEYYIREQDDILLNNGQEQTTMKCWVYFLKNFKQSLLSSPHLENYSSTGDHGMPYTERFDPSNDDYDEEYDVVFDKDQKGQ